MKRLPIDIEDEYRPHPVDLIHEIHAKVTEFADIPMTPQQSDAWDSLVLTDEFLEAQDRRIQMKVAFDELVAKKQPGQFTQKLLADRFDVSRTFLKRQVDKAGEILKNGRPSLLDTEDYDKIRKWLQEQIKLKDYPTLQMIYDFVYVVLRKSPNKDSFRHYIKSNFPEYKFVEGVPIEDNRFDVAAKDIDDYYSLLEDKIASVDYRFFGNLDETGEDQYVDTHAVRVFVPADVKETSVKIPVSRKQKRFTIIHTIWADGLCSDPYIIIPRVTLEGDIYRYVDPQRTKFVQQPKGFVNNEAFKDFWDNWLMPQIRDKRKRWGYTGLAIMLMDNHRSHRYAIGGGQDDKFTFLPDENLLVIWLVPHSSDQTQPLDLGIFGLQKRASQGIRKDSELTVFTNSLLRAIVGLQSVSTDKNVVSAFKSAGIDRIILYGKYSWQTKIKLTIDRKEARAVRSFPSFTPETTFPSERTLKIQNHNEDSPRIKVLQF